MMPMPQLPPITMLSLLHFCGAIGWCVVLLSAIAGYGAGLLRLAQVRRPGLAMATLAGFGVVLSLGGLLNLIRAITVPMLLSTVALGLVAGVLAMLLLGVDTTLVPLSRRAEPQTLASRLLLAMFVLMFLFRLGATVHTPYYQPSDDYNFYLAAPVKMVQTHVFGADPFSERRVMSSVGGNVFLEALVLAELPLEDVQMADRALGLMLSALVVLALARAFQLSAADTAAWALFVVATPQLQFNLTFVVLPAALLLGMVYLAVREEGLVARPWLRGVLLGLVAGAITSMKSTYVVPGFLFLLFYAGRMVWRAEAEAAALKLAGGAVLASLAVLLPWMLVNRWAAGTAFYPILGHGFHYTRWGGFAPPGNHSAHVIWFKVLPFSIPPLLVFVFGWRRGRQDRTARLAMLMTLAAAVATILVGVATGGDSVRRYNYPALLPGVLLLFPVVCRPRWARGAGAGVGGKGSGAYVVGAAVAAGTALYVGFNSFTWEYPWAVRCLRTSLTEYRILPNTVVDPAEGDRTRARYEALEASIPATGGATLETLTDAYLLDFGRREIFLGDVPGAASPAPGWPARQSGEALARYLLMHHIRYLAYSYADGASETDQAAAEQSANRHNSQWIRAEAEIVLSAHRQYEELGRTRRHLYDDGHSFLLDLAAPREAASKS